METHELARLGDTIETEVKHPQSGVLRVQLLTLEACAMGNGLLMDKASGWHLVPRSANE
jgi:hypothetical protein